MVRKAYKKTETLLGELQGGTFHSGGKQGPFPLLPSRAETARRDPGPPGTHLPQPRGQPGYIGTGPGWDRDGMGMGSGWGWYRHWDRDRNWDRDGDGLGTGSGRAEGGIGIGSGRAEGWDRDGDGLGTRSGRAPEALPARRARPSPWRLTRSRSAALTLPCPAMAPKGGPGGRQQSEEDLLLQDFSRNLSAKSSALFFGNAFIVSAIPICERARAGGLREGSGGLWRERGISSPGGSKIPWKRGISSL